jgi:hypothetical protein
MDENIGSELARLRSEISDLRKATSKVDGLERTVSKVDDKLSGVAATASKTQADVRKLSDDFKRFRDIQAARDKRADLQREIDAKFGQHREVRRLAANIIHIVGVGFIDRAVLLDVAQRRMMDVPGYWLSPANIAVAAWLSDDKDRCSEALRYALACDPGKTALFMALILRHHARGRALREWLATYLSGLEPTNLPSEFQVVIDAVAGSALGDGSAPELAERMTIWYGDATRSRDTEANAIESWKRRLRSLAATGDYARQFRVLARCSPDWAALRERHEVTTAIEAAEVHFRGRFTAGADVPANLSEQVSSLLAKLAETPDPDEEKLIRQLRQAEAFLETGDEASARRRVTGEEAGRTGSLNILSMVSTAAFPKAAEGVLPPPTVTELLTIVLSGQLIGAAAESLDEQSRRPGSVEVRVGSRQQRTCTFSCADDDITPEGLREQSEERAAQIRADISRETSERQDKLRKFARRVLPVALPASAALGAVPFVIPTGAPAIDFVGPAIVIAAPALGWLSLLPMRLRKVVTGGSREEMIATQAVREASAELGALLGQDTRSRALLAGLLEYLRGLRPDDAYRATRLVSSPPLPRSRDFPGWTPSPPSPPSQRAAGTAIEEPGGRPPLGPPLGPPPGSARLERPGWPATENGLDGRTLT